MITPPPDPRKENAAAAMPVACGGNLHDDDDCTVCPFRYLSNGDFAVIDENLDGDHAHIFH